MVKYIDMIEDRVYLRGGMHYKKNKGILYCEEDLKWRVSYESMHNIVENMAFEEIPWEPEYGENYYYPTFTKLNGFRISKWKNENDDCDNMIKKAVGVYKTPEEAQAKARELGWLE